jgi:MFS family permease
MFLKRPTLYYMLLLLFQEHYESFFQMRLTHASHLFFTPPNPSRYDFAVYGLLAPEIGASFFPSASKELQLINSFGVYLAAFLMRPLGAIVFGEMGDRIVGRKNALVFSIVLITVPSILMGCLPTYATWGWISPVLLVLLRMMQGLSMGGQLAGSYILSIEQSSARSRGFRGSLCDASSVRLYLYSSFVHLRLLNIFLMQRFDGHCRLVDFC